MTPVATEIKHATRCRLCGHEFRARPFSLDAIGQIRVKKFFDAVSVHMQANHAEYMAAATISAFATEDPTLIPLAEKARAEVAARTRSHTATDDAIRSQLARAGFTEDEIVKSLPVFREMRDYLTEQGQYAPK